MDNDKLISKVIQIAGEKYPVRLTEKESHIANEIERELNKKIRDFQLKYVVKSKSDVLAMLLLTYAFESKMVTETDDFNLANSRIERLLKTFAALEEE
jgi:cell division protein ZapA (FtsZ GTPase activity inhibitor)